MNDLMDSWREEGRREVSSTLLRSETMFSYGRKEANPRKRSDRQIAISGLWFILDFESVPYRHWEMDCELTRQIVQGSLRVTSWPNFYRGESVMEELACRSKP